MEIIDAYLLAPEIDFSYVGRERPKRKAVIFDLDGTIYHGTFLLDILNELGSYFKQEEILGLKRNSINLRKLEKEINKKLEKVPLKAIEQAKLRAANEFCKNFYKEKNFYRGVHSLLLELSRENYDVYLVSYSPVNLVENCLKNYFKGIYGSRFENNQIEFVDKIRITSEVCSKNNYELLFMVTDDLSLDFSSLPYIEGSFFFIVPVKSQEKKAYARGRYITVEGEDSCFLRKVIHNIEYWYMNSKEGENEKKIIMRNLKEIKKQSSYLRPIQSKRAFKLLLDCAIIRKVKLKDVSLLTILMLFPEIELF